MLHDNRQALARYNTLFDNRQYQAITHSLAADLRAKRDSSTISGIMQCITDTALSLCQHSHYDDAWLRLAAFCGRNAVSVTTIDLICGYLLIFQQPADTRVNDFELTAKALRKAYEATNILKTSVSLANGVHGWSGRMAYDLLAAADYLTQAAIQLLLHGNLSYIVEKLGYGLRRVSGALNEARQSSERPDLFDFNEIDFPTRQNRQ